MQKKLRQENSLVKATRFGHAIPINNNKLLIQWKGAYQFIQRMGDYNYKILCENKEKIYHVNIQKNYSAGKDKAQSENKKEGLKMVAIVEVLSDEETSSIDMETLLELDTIRQIENVFDVKLETELNNCQSRQF